MSLFLTLSNLFAQTDTLIFKNGNMVVGEIKSMSRGVIQIETDYSDSDFMIEWEKVNNTLFELLGSYCGKPAKQVMEDATRDLWLSAEAALEYGIIDEIVKTKKKGN